MRLSEIVMVKSAVDGGASVDQGPVPQNFPKSIPKFLPKLTF